MNLSIRSKIIAFVLPIIPALIIFSAMLESTHRESDALRNGIVQTYEVNNTISALLSAIQRAEIGERDYLIGHEKDSLDLYLVSVNDIESQLATLRRLTKGNPIQRLRVKELDALLQKELAALEKAISLAQTSPSEGAVTITLHTLAIEEEIRHILAAMANEESSLLSLRKSEFEQHRVEQQRIELMLLIGVAMLYLILAVLLIRSIAQPINALAIKANKMANGNYSGKMEELGTDELGQLSRAFNKATEAIQLRSQEAEDKQTRLQTVIESSIEGIITINNMGLIESINSMALKMFGFSKDELIGKNINLLMPEPYRSEHDGYLQHYKQTGVKKIIGIGREVSGLRKDRSVFPMELSVSEMNINGQQLFSGLVRDITERKNFELEIQNRESRYRSVITTVIDGIITIDKHGLIESMNPAAEKIFGYPLSEAKGQNLKILMPESYHKEYDYFLLNYKSSGEGKIIGSSREVKGLRKGGVIFPMELSISELHVGGELMFSGLFRDITERKRVDTMKNEFISTVSHELRTPLTSIQGALELMLSGAMGKVPDTCTPLLKIASNNSARLVRLINDILDVEKIESGKMELKLKAIDINQLVEESILANQAYGDEHGVKFNITKRALPCHVLADSDRLIQVMTNLLSNAAKFSHLNSTVDVDVQIIQDLVQVSVIDYGAGIPDEFKDRIFNKFSQADSSSTKQQGGTGLGLSICKAIIEKLDGRIDYESEADKKTRFYFELPIHDQTIVENELAGDTPSEHILICEDDLDVARLLKIMLEKKGYSADIAGSAEQAKECLLKKQYAAMTLDLMLPGQSGIDFFKELKQTEGLSELPIIVISAVADEGKKQLNGDALSIYDWLEKPIDQNRLAMAIRHALRGKSDHQFTILHVEDDPDIVTLVGTLLKGKATIDVAHNLKTAHSKLTNSYDLVILDLMLPDGSGATLLPKLASKTPPVPVVVFSALDRTEDLGNSVDASLVKSKTSNHDLVQAIELILQRHTNLDKD